MRRLSSAPLFMALLLCAAGVGALPIISPAAPTAEMLRQQDQIIRTDEDRQRQLERQHKEMLDREQSHLESGQQNATGAAGDDTVCVQVRTITLTGATLLSPSEKAALIRPYVDQCLSMRRINELIRAVTDRTVGAGGDAALTAGRNVTIASATDSQEFSRHSEGKSGGFFGGKSSESVSGSSTTNVAAKVASGGGLTVKAGAAGSGDLVVSGSKAASADDVKMTAAGCVTIAAARELSFLMMGSFLRRLTTTKHLRE